MIYAATVLKFIIIIVAHTLKNPSHSSELALKLSVWQKLPQQTTFRFKFENGIIHITMLRKNLFEPVPRITATLCSHVTLWNFILDYHTTKTCDAFEINVLEYRKKYIFNIKKYLLYMSVFNFFTDLLINFFKFNFVIVFYF